MEKKQEMANILLNGKSSIITIVMIVILKKRM